MKFQYEPGEYYVQCAETKHFLALQGKYLRLDNTQTMIPTFSGLVKLVQNGSGSTALYSSLNDMRIEENFFGELVTISQENKETGKVLERFELFQAAGNEKGQLIIRSIQTKMFVRVSESLRLRVDVEDPLGAAKFILKSRYFDDYYFVFIHYESTE